MQMINGHIIFSNSIQMKQIFTETPGAHSGLIGLIDAEYGCFGLLIILDWYYLTFPSFPWFEYTHPVEKERFAKKSEGIRVQPMGVCKLTLEKKGEVAALAGGILIEFVDERELHSSGGP